MKLKHNNDLKPKPIFLDMKTATKTFKRILENQKPQKHLINNKIISSKTDRFFHMINKAFFKQDIKEKDQDYIYREIKRLQKYNQKLSDLYGTNALFRSLPSGPEPIKYDKKLLFNPYKKENDKSFNMQYKYNILSRKRKMNLPFIFSKKNNMRLIKKDSKGNYFNKSKTSDKYNISGYNSLNTESSSKYHKQYLTYKNNNNSKISNLSEGSNKFNRNEYLITLDSLYDETIYSHKKQKKYFNSVDYGCSFYINKCNYISKNLFNK